MNKNQKRAIEQFLKSVPAIEDDDIIPISGVRASSLSAPDADVVEVLIDEEEGR